MWAAAALCFMGCPSMFACIHVRITLWSVSVDANCLVAYRTVMFVTQEYRLMYRVFDDKFANTTTVIIQVLDVNDNAPRFDNAIYNVTDVQEEEEGISKNNHKYLLTVRLINYVFFLFLSFKHTHTHTHTHLMALFPGLPM